MNKNKKNTFIIPVNNNNKRNDNNIYELICNFMSKIVNKFIDRRFCPLVDIREFGSLRAKSFRPRKFEKKFF